MYLQSDKFSDPVKVHFTLEQPGSSSQFGFQCLFNLLELLGLKTIFTKLGFVLPYIEAVLLILLGGELLEGCFWHLKKAEEDEVLWPLDG